MIDIKIIASSSAGNAYLVTDGNHKLLIEAGIRFADLQKALDYKTSELDAVLISHEHKDHCKAVKEVMRLGVPVVLSEGTRIFLDLDPSFCTDVFASKETTVNQWKILPFDVEHDAVEPLGFLIKSPSGKKILYATDTYFIRYFFTGVNFFMIEANYSNALLDLNTEVDETVKSRIRRSHFEFENVLEFLNSCDLKQTEKIFLLHLSKQNSDRDHYIKTIEEKTGVPCYA